MIIVNRLHHELLISYYKDLYDRLPHGHPGTHRGRPVLYITYIPNEPSVTPKNTIPNDRDILYNGHYLRSKNELIVCEALNNLGYEFKTEISITTDDFKTFDPDVTYYIPEIEKPVSMEIDGALDKDGYFAKSNERKIKYLSSGFDEFRDVVFFRIYNPYSFDYDRLEAIIKATILVNMGDIII